MNSGKLDIIKTEMEQLNIDILGIVAHHWIGSGYFSSDDCAVYYFGNENIRCNGFAFIANKKISKAVQFFNGINDNESGSYLIIHGKHLNHDIAGLCANHRSKFRGC